MELKTTSPPKPLAKPLSDFKPMLRWHRPIIFRKPHVKEPEKKRYLSDDETAIKHKPETQSEEEIRKKESIEKALAKIFPPRIWEEHGRKWIQKVSAIPVKRKNVRQLKHKIFVRIKETQANLKGLCPIRRAIFADAFNEIIRHVTLHLTDRGHMLHRIRDEFEKSLVCYETLYCHARRYGLSKREQATIETEPLREYHEELEKEVEELEEEVDELKQQRAEEKAVAEEVRSSFDRRFARELDFYKTSNAQLRNILEGILNPPKK